MNDHADKAYLKQESYSHILFDVLGAVLGALTLVLACFI